MAKRYRPAEVCRLLDLQPYVLRYWATEFPTLAAPSDGAGAQGSYSADDLAQLKRIKQLLYEEGYTIAGARKKLESEPHPGPDAAASAPLFAEDDEENVGESVESIEPIKPSKKSARLDTPDDERIESLRRGVAAALDEARDLLSLFERNR
jgi:DNA-binding transcriptional MerR regulator